MSEKVTLARWPLYLALVVLTAAFAWVFVLSVEHAKTERSVELTMDISNGHPGTQELQITPKLGTLPPDSSASRHSPLPALWWPVLLFGLAFLCGWLYRHETRVAPQSESKHDRLERQSMGQLEEIQNNDTEVNGENTYTSDEQQGPYTSIEATNTAEFDANYQPGKLKHPHTQEPTSEERIARLEKKNASKAEIIKALETLVAENHEKWLHRGETEARLNSHIQVLSDDLRVANRQLQRLQADSLSATGTHRKAI